MRFHQVVPTRNRQIHPNNSNPKTQMLGIPQIKDLKPEIIPVEASWQNRKCAGTPWLMLIKIKSRNQP